MKISILLKLIAVGVFQLFILWFLIYVSLASYWEFPSAQTLTILTGAIFLVGIYILLPYFKHHSILNRQL
ncbi:hypothetical protein [Christiangramia flava]|uniref:hypothetical protein n=1 Tax=Christiangramia flava TaxID=1486245 RepID=UPI00111C2778|nr:hypothetical protein [Christiangramia flava]